MSELRLDISNNTDIKVPKFLRPANYDVASRPKLPIDQVEGDGTALDIVKRKPSHKFKVYSRVGKKLKEAEEWVDFISEKRGMQG